MGSERFISGTNRKFDSKIYKYKGTFGRKSDAQNRKAWFKGKGMSVRIVKTAAGYVVFAR